MNAKELLKQIEDDKVVAVTFSPNTIVVTGAGEVTVGLLFRNDNRIYLSYLHPNYTVAEKPVTMEQEVGSEWILDTDQFELS